MFRGLFRVTTWLSASPDQACKLVSTSDAERTCFVQGELEKQDLLGAQPTEPELL
jgi:hypothetical protein